jgi:hypothetical protein
MELGYTRRLRFLGSLFITLAIVLTLNLFDARAAWAQRLIFSREGVLYAAGEDASNPRRLFAIGVGPEVLWAVSPDGRRIAWMTRGAAKNGSEGAGLTGRPAIVTVAEALSGGQRRKKLFSTETLKDRQGKAVTVVGVPPGTSNVSGDFAQWEPVSMAWSADSRTLYLSCAYTGDAPALSPGDGPPVPIAKGTYGVDAATGAAFIDADGRWKLISPVTQLEAQGGLLVGSGVGRTTIAENEVFYAPLVVTNLLEGTRTPLLTAGQAPSLPEYAYALNPALGFENRSIAFVSANRGLWTVDKFGKSYRRLMEGAVQRPRWSIDGERLLFLLPRPLTSGDKVVYDLYQIDVPKDETALPGPPRLVLQTVDWFDVVPD